jgi:hypothetical protein
LSPENSRIKLEILGVKGNQAGNIGGQGKIDLKILGGQREIIKLEFQRVNEKYAIPPLGGDVGRGGCGY